MPLSLDEPVACTDAQAVALLRTLCLTYAGHIAPSSADAGEYRLELHHELFDAEMILSLQGIRSVRGRVWPKPSEASEATLAAIRNVAAGHLRAFALTYRDCPHKSFGIGFPRTGTTSLRDALRHLSLFTLHYAPWLADDIAAGVYRSETTDAYAAMLDSPFPLIYKQLDRIYPNSKFILTTRAVEEWLPSIRDTGGGYDIEQYRRMYYGTAEFDEDLYRRAFSAHLQDVTSYFAARPRDLLVLNCSGALSWRAVCAFLGLPEPRHTPYPWASRRPAVERVS